MRPRPSQRRCTPTTPAGQALRRAASVADVGGRATLTVEEAAALLGIGRSAAYEAARRGQLPTRRVGRRLLVPVPALLEWLGVPATPPRPPHHMEDLADGITGEATTS